MTIERYQEQQKQRFKQIEDSKKIFQLFVIETQSLFWLGKGYECDTHGNPRWVVYNPQIIEEFESWMRQRILDKVRQTKELWPFQGVDLRLEWKPASQSIMFNWEWPDLILESCS